MESLGTVDDSTLFQDILCRVCATTDASCALIHVLEKQGSEECVANILHELAGVKVARNDGFPQQCCSVCHMELLQAVSVRRRCIESDKLFQSSIKSEKLFRSSIDSSCFQDDDHNHDPCDSFSSASSIHEDIPPDKQPCYHCNECVIDFSDSETLEKHYESKHSNVIYGWESFGISEISAFDTTDEDEEEDVVLNHPPTAQNLIPNNPDHRCCGCKSVFDTEAELQQHSAAVHVPNAVKPTEDKPFQCELCYNTFTTKLGVRVHQVTNQTARYQCAFCGAMFGKQSQCNSHEKIHSNQELNCNVCGKAFRTAQNLKRHKAKHVLHQGSRKKYVCDLCGASLLSADYLKFHMRLHAEKRPYSCKLCGVRFKAAEYLKRHRKTHEKLYTCQQCGITCQGYYAMLGHMRTHSEGKRFSCTKCSAYFSSKQNLTRHTKKCTK